MGINENIDKIREQFKFDETNFPYRWAGYSYFDDPELEFLFTTEKDTDKTDPASWLVGEIETVDEIHQRIDDALNNLNQVQITRLKKRLKELQNGDTKKV